MFFSDDPTNYLFGKLSGRRDNEATDAASARLPEVMKQWNNKRQSLARAGRSTRHQLPPLHTEHACVCNRSVIWELSYQIYWQATK